MPWTDCFIRPGEDGYISPGEDETEPGCFDVPSDFGVPVCTRTQGHDGEHAAHDTENNMLAHWPPTT